jgi:hypothetical protein
MYVVAGAVVVGAGFGAVVRCTTVVRAGVADDRCGAGATTVARTVVAAGRSPGTAPADESRTSRAASAGRTATDACSAWMGGFAFASPPVMRAMPKLAAKPRTASATAAPILSTGIR